MKEKAFTLNPCPTGYRQKTYSRIGFFHLGIFIFFFFRNQTIYFPETTLIQFRKIFDRRLSIFN